MRKTSLTNTETESLNTRVSMGLEMVPARQFSTESTFSLISYAPDINCTCKPGP